MLKTSFLLVLLIVFISSSEEFSDSLTVYSSSMQDDKLSSTESYHYIKVTEEDQGKTLSSIISKSSGVSTQKMGGAGSFETVSIRGVDGSRVAVFYNGIPLNSSMGGAVDLSQIPLNQVDAVEIYKGITPASLGGNSLGGAINIIGKGSRAKSCELSFLVGSFGEFKGSALLSNKVENSNLLGNISYHYSKNDYPYLDRNGTAYNPNDDTLRDLNNNELNDFNSNISVTREINNNRLSLYWLHTQKRMGIPAAEGMINQTAYTSGREDLLIAKSDKSISIGNLTNTFSLSYMNDYLFWTGLDNYGIASGVLKPGEVGELQSSNFYTYYSFGYKLFTSNLLKIDGVSQIKYEQMLPQTDVADFGVGDWKSNRSSFNNSADLSFYFGDFSTIVGGSFTLIRDHTEGGEDPYTKNYLPTETTIKTNYSARLGVNYFLLNGDLSLFTNGGYYRKVPSLRELYGYQGAVIPNPNLSDEKGFNTDLGVSYINKKLSAELTLFYNHFEDLISIVFDGRISRATNIGENRSYGVEASLLWDIVTFISIQEAVTFQKTENLTELYNGNLLPDQVPFTSFSELVVGPFYGVRFTTDVTYKSKYYHDLANLKPFPADTNCHGFTELSFYLDWKYKNLSIRGGFLNVLDSRVHNDSKYSLESGYYQTLYPGRSLQLLTTITF